MTKVKTYLLSAFSVLGGVLCGLVGAAVLIPAGGMICLVFEDVLSYLFSLLDRLGFYELPLYFSEHPAAWRFVIVICAGILICALMWGLLDHLQDWLSEPARDTEIQSSLSPARSCSKVPVYCLQDSYYDPEEGKVRRQVRLYTEDGLLFLCNPAVELHLTNMYIDENSQICVQDPSLLTSSEN